MLRPLLTVALLTLAALPGRAAPPSFLNDVMPLLTKQGCNQGACHGKGSGQNGFALSLRGYDPDADFKRLTRELDARRIDPAQPERSLLLLKATGTASHEGGAADNGDATNALRVTVRNGRSILGSCGERRGRTPQ